LLALGQGDRLVGVGGGAHEEDVLLLRQELREGATKLRLVVGDEHADPLRRPILPGAGDGEAAHGVGTVPTGSRPFNRPAEGTRYPPSVLPAILDG
jgi:hypothetical protein